ncbi:response regulator transcription factor [Oxobacter pfennigii]|nr:response regulator transcription factor [Oxobacter pfennigii]
MKTHSILVVDDDPDIVEIISLYLTNAGYQVSTASTSTEALKKIQETDFDLIILDVILPDFDGTDLCEQIRLSLSCPVLFISCMDDEQHILHALRIGGDDYIRKPFYPNELVARVETNLRRTASERKNAPAHSDELSVRDLVIDLKKYVVYKNYREIILPPIEFEILLYMFQRPNRVLPYEEIYEHVWHNESLGDTRTVMVHVSNLRKKLEDRATDKYIKTIKKRGYMFLT